MKTTKLMKIKYTSDGDANLLKTRLNSCGIDFCAFREYEFIDGGAAWTFFIDKSGRTWSQIMSEVNSVRAVKFRYVDGLFIENGRLRLEDWENH